LYSLQSNFVKHQILWNEGTGSTVSNIRIPFIENLIIPLPPLPEQKAIADILSSLDDKIELNNRMNKTLEQMARAVFKRWFVDFEFPLDYARGKPGDSSAGSLHGLLRYAPDGATQQALLQQRSLSDAKHRIAGSGYKSSGGKMVDSELGMIPEGWRVCQFYDVIEIKHGFAFKGNYITNEPNENILLTPGNFQIGGGFKTDKFRYYTGEIPEDYILLYPIEIGFPHVMSTDHRHESFLP
jgi:type I restriction enzyme S subunit